VTTVEKNNNPLVSKSIFLAVCRVQRACCRRTAVLDGEVGEVGPAGAEQDGGFSHQSVHSVPTGVLQAGGHSEAGDSHRDTVTLNTTAQVSRQEVPHQNVDFQYHPILV